MKSFFCADDLIFYSINSNDIQEPINVLHSWCVKNKVKVNISETNILKFRKAGRLCIKDHFTYDNQAVIISSSYEYLQISF